MARMLTVLSLLAATTVAYLSRGVSAHGNDAMSHAFIAEAIPATDVVMAATTTEGPYFEAESDYISSTDLTAAARAGSAGVTTDRVSVLNGVPLNVTLTFYSVSDTTATELVGADVFLWHCDAIGSYSAVSQADQRSEGTLGQKWLRGVQQTPSSGAITFKTIMPGWYTGRAVHFHVRVRLAGSTSWAVTTQLFVADASLNAYKTLAPYTSDSGTITPLASDGIYSGISSAVAAKLTLNLAGSTSSGYTAAVNIGITTSGTSSATTTTSTSAGVASPPTTTSATTTTTTAASTPLGSATTPASSATGTFGVLAAVIAAVSVILLSA